MRAINVNFQMSCVVQLECLLTLRMLNACIHVCTTESIPFCIHLVFLLQCSIMKEYPIVWWWHIIIIIIHYYMYLQTGKAGQLTVTIKSLSSKQYQCSQCQNASYVQTQKYTIYVVKLFQGGKFKIANDAIIQRNIFTNGST